MAEQAPIKREPAIAFKEHLPLGDVTIKDIQQQASDNTLRRIQQEHDVRPEMG